MQKVLRGKTRRFLFQALYARILLGEAFALDSFVASFFQQGGFFESLDKPYFDEVFAGVIEKEADLIYIVKKFAPRFDIAIMPVANIIPVFIGAYEMLYIKETIPEKVIINEALEITKLFSDSQARTLVNGILNSLKEKKDEVAQELKTTPPTTCYFFSDKL